MSTFFRTAYEESLTGTGEEGDPELEATGSRSLPSYMVAASTHNVANGNEDFSTTLSNIPKFVQVSLISGVNQIYNAPASIGNMFGGDFDVSGPDEYIANLDSNLGEYYQEHKEAADLVGFLASSWIPGMAGVKALHAGQAALKASMVGNKMGTLSSKALGLMVPDKQRHLNKALSEAVNGNSVPSLINRNVLRAAGAGLGQATYEAAFFEMAVAVTMQDSPILEGQDLGDFASNVAWGAGLFGVVGGGISAVKSYYGVKGIAKEADKATSPWRYSAAAASISDPYAAIALDLSELKAMPTVPVGGIKVGDADTVIEAGTIASMAKTKTAAIENSIRSNVGKISKGDEVVAEELYNSFIGSSIDRRLGAFIGLKGSSRLADVTPIEKVRLRAEKAVAAGDVGDLLEAERLLDVHTSYVRMWGAFKGATLDAAPAVTSVVDTLKKGQSILVAPKGVQAGKKMWKFDTKTPWSAIGSDAVTANARQLWVHGLKPFASMKKKGPIIVDETDIPMMEKVFREFDSTIQIRDAAGDIRTYGDSEEFLNRLVRVKEEVAIRLAATPTPPTPSAAGKTGKIAAPLSQEEVEAIVNVRSGYMGGLRSQNLNDDVFALQSYAEEHTRELVAKGVRKPEAGVVNLAEVPQTIKLTYDKADLTGLTEGHVVENMVRIKQQQKIYKMGTDNAAHDVLGDEAKNFLEITESKIQDSANRIGAGAGGATAASSNLGTLAADMEYLGKTVLRTIDKARTSTREALDPVLYKLGQDREAAIEYATLSNTLRSIPDNYTLHEVLNEAGEVVESAMVPLALKKWEKAAADATTLGNAVPERPILTALDAPEYIPIKNAAVADTMRMEIELNSKVINSYAKLRSAQGTTYSRDPEAYYPIPVDPKDYKHFAIVKDNSITGTGHSKTLYASSAEELQAMGAKLEAEPNLSVMYKGDAEEYYKARNQFEYEKTLSDNYLDAAMYRKGVSSSYFVPTDPAKIVNDTLNWHLQRQSGLIREAVAVKYEVPFAELRRLGDKFTKVETSQFSAISTLKYAEDTIQNPYTDFIKTALGIRKYSDYPMLVEPNKFVDRAFTKMFDKVQGATLAAKNLEELGAVNSILKEAGYKGAAYDETSDLFANHQARKGLLSSVVQSANSLIATVVLRWDPLNAVNNAVSANVLLGAETRSVLKAIRDGDPEAAGELAKLTNVMVPGTDNVTFTSGKMIANAMSRFGRNTPDMQFYKDHGYITSIHEQYARALDDLTFNGKESIESWKGRLDGVHKNIKKTANTLEEWTGNRLAEEFNRFVAADVMKQLTDIAVKRDLISPQEQLAYINTFVNRTQGNYLAAQRPMMFQGPIGQAVGLFQTYQFNLMQQLLRHVGEGRGKDAMTLLALQGTIHGANGLPAFNAINTTIVGNASGNTEHRDLFDATYGVVGKEAGNWLMYGMASNMLIDPDLKVNLYTRGDINPRHLTIIPTDPSQVPIVQASVRFFSNIFETAGKLSAGGDVATTILQGLEHNALSRPLAGLAQTLEGLANPMRASYSTSNQGNVIASNDLLSLANLGRIVGGKPLDEAIALDASFRYKSYGLKDTDRKRKLGEAIKTTMIAGQEPTEEQIAEFAEKYAAAGGKSEQFNSWFVQQYKTANLSQTNKLSQDLNGKFSQSMQRIMGGAELRDFTE